MDAVLVGILTGLTVAVGTLYWTLLARPEALLAQFGEPGVQEAFFGEHPVLLRALRWTTGGVLLLLGFLTGLATAFLAST